MGTTSFVMALAETATGIAGATSIVFPGMAMGSPPVEVTALRESNVKRTLVTKPAGTSKTATGMGVRGAGNVTVIGRGPENGVRIVSVVGSDWTVRKNTSTRRTTPSSPVIPEGESVRLNAMIRGSSPFPASGFGIAGWEQPAPPPTSPMTIATVKYVRLERCFFNCIAHTRSQNAFRRLRRRQPRGALARRRHPPSRGPSRKSSPTTRWRSRPASK